MKRTRLVSMLLASVLMFSGIAVAEPVTLDGKDTVVSVLRGHMNKRVTIKLNSGDELTGKLKAVRKNAIHLNALSGKEFFDAVIKTDQVAAVIIRVRDR